MRNRRARIGAGWILGGLLGAVVGYYLPLLWWYFANGLSDTGGGLSGVDPVPWLAPIGALIGAGVSGYVIADRMKPGEHSAVQTVLTPAEPTIIEVQRSDVWSTAASGAGLTAIGLGTLVFIGVADARGTSTSDLVGSLVVGVPIMLFPLVIGAFELHKSVRHLRTRLPALRLDDTGLECTYGRIAWSDVESVEKAALGDGGSLVRFTFRHGATWEPSNVSYSRYFLISRKSDGFSMDYWGRPSDVRETLRRYYAGPISV